MNWASSRMALGQSTVRIGQPNTASAGPIKGFQGTASHRHPPHVRDLGGLPGGRRSLGHHRARRPHRPRGNSQREHPDQPLLERPGQQRRLRPHRLQDRGLPGWHLQLDRPRRRHRRQHHNLRPHRPRRRRHASLPRLRHQRQRHRRRLRLRQRHHRGGHRARRPHRPLGKSQRDHADQPLLDRPGQHRRLRPHRLQDRGLLRWRLQLDRPRRRHHHHHHHHLRPQRPFRQQHPPLPGLGHQLGRHRHPVHHRQRHHRRHRPRGLEPQAHRPDDRRPVPAAVPLLHQAQRYRHRNRDLQHLRPGARRGRPRRHPGLQPGLQGGRLHFRRRRPRQHRHHVHRQRQGRPRLLARRRQGRRRVRGFL